MALNRDPMQVDPEFKSLMIKLQKKIELIEGRTISMRELTKKIAQRGGIEELEKRLIKNKIQGDLKLKLDGRF